MKKLCNCFEFHLIGSILYVDFLERKPIEVENFFQQVDKIIYIN